MFLVYDCAVFVQCLTHFRNDVKSAELKRFASGDTFVQICFVCKQKNDVCIASAVHIMLTSFERRANTTSS